MIKLYEGNISESTKKVMKEKHGIEMKHIEDHKREKAKVIPAKTIKNIVKVIQGKSITIPGTTRNALMLQAKEKGIKNFRILNKSELIEILNSAHQERIDQIIKEAKKRWMSGWGSKAAATVAMILLVCNMAFAGTLTASWYSEASLIKEGTWKDGQERRMANNEYFNENALTAASWDFPLGSRVKVTTVKAPKKSIIVEVTDRTNRRFKGKRIDLSKRAFSEIAPLKQGLISVSVEVVK